MELNPTFPKPVLHPTLPQPPQKPQHAPMIEPLFLLIIKDLQARGAEIPAPLLGQGLVPAFVVEFAGELRFGFVDHGDHVVEVGQRAAPVREDEGFRAAWDAVAEGIWKARSGGAGACREGETGLESVRCCCLIGVGAGVHLGPTLQGYWNEIG